MARIEHREWPHVTTKVAINIGGAYEVAVADFWAFPFVATKPCFVHQMNIRIDTLGGADADLQLKALNLGDDLASVGTVILLSDVVDVGSGGSGTVGGYISSDLALPNLDNSTDEVDMDNQANPAPYEMAEGDMLYLDLSGANIGTFAGTVEVLISEQPH